MKLTYNIIASGSSGNCTVVNNSIAIDMGVPYSHIKQFVPQLKIVLLTHAHTDHFNSSTINRIHTAKPTIRFAVPPYLAKRAVECGIDERVIDVITTDDDYDYGKFSVRCERIPHNVPNVCWKLNIGNEKLIYATDTSSLDLVVASNYDVYLVEANHEEEEILERAKAKELLGEYAYEYEAMNNHLSREKCDKWLVDMVGDKSIVEYMHRHGGNNDTLEFALL